MLDWLAGIVGEEAAPIVSYALILILILVAFFGLRSIMRRMRDGTFINGGQSRQQRLAIMDATPVDNRRRLVLVRRDNVEHLVLIGGMNDIVIEQNIKPEAEIVVQSDSQTPAIKPMAERAAPVAPQKSEPVGESEPVRKQPEIMAQPVVEQPAPTPKPTPVPPSERNRTAPRVAAAGSVATVAAMGGSTAESPKPATMAKTEKVELPPEIRQEPVLRREPVLPSESPGSETASAIDEENFEPVVPTEPQSVSEPRVEPELEPRVDEFRPINEVAPAQETSMAKVPEPETEEVDLEDEMEQLLNKLTSSARK